MGLHVPSQTAYTYVNNGNSSMGKMTIKYENEDSNANMPDGMGLYAYLANIKVPLSGGSGSGEFYYKVYFPSTSYSDSSSRDSTTNYIALGLALKTKSGYISIGEITKKPDLSLSSSLPRIITYDGHTIKWSGNTHSSNSALYIDGKYFGVLRGEYYFKM